MATIKNLNSATVWREMTSANFRILARYPTTADRLRLHGIAASGAYPGVGYAASESAAAWHQITSIVAEWDGVYDEDEKPVPFSETALRSLCDQCPAVLRELFALADEFYAIATPEKN